MTELRSERRRRRCSVARADRCAIRMHTREHTLSYIAKRESARERESARAGERVDVVQDYLERQWRQWRPRRSTQRASTWRRQARTRRSARTDRLAPSATATARHRASATQRHTTRSAAHITRVCRHLSSNGSHSCHSTPAPTLMTANTLR